MDFTETNRFRRVSQDQEGKGSKKTLASEMSSSQATGEYTNLNPCILEDAQQIRFPRKGFRHNEVGEGESQFSGENDGATVFGRKLNAPRNLEATTEQHPVLESCLSKTIARPVNRDCMLFGINLIDRRDSRDEQQQISCDRLSQESHCKAQRNPTRSRTKVFKQGNSIGRSVDLTKFEGFPELIGELEVLFNLQGQLQDSSKGWRVVYKDVEGDMMLLGDGPWQEFCRVVTKIFIQTREVVDKMATNVTRI